MGADRARLGPAAAGSAAPPTAREVWTVMAHENFVAADWLAAHLGEPDLGVIDASWHLPPTGRRGDAEFRQGHVPGAVFFNIDVIADTASGLPHMLPDAGAFAKAMTALGLGDGMHFVVYDTLGLFASARVWWTLRAYGVRADRKSTRLNS